MRGDGGYTLIELLATLLVLGSVFLLLTSGIGTSRRVWEHADARSDATDVVVSAQNLLRASLEHAFPQTRLDGSSPYVDFKGETSSLSFLAKGADRSGSALSRYDVKVSEGGDLEMDTSSDLAAEGTPTRNQPLLHGVESVSFAYFGTPPGGKGAAGWQPRWQSRATLPNLVKVHVELPPGDRRVWPDLIVHPLPNTDTLCVLDRRTGSCRGRA